MGRRLRFVPQGGALVEVTCRTIQGRFLLRPSDRLRDLTLGVLARAACLYPVEVHAFVFMSNHYHLLLSVPNAQHLAQFMGYLNSNLAREICRVTGWRDKVWSRRYQAIVVSIEAEAQVARLRYILAHGVKEGLVEHPSEWPGPHSVSALLDGSPLQGVWFDRTGEWKARHRDEPFHPPQYTTREVLALSPLPCWADYSTISQRKLVSELLEAICLELQSRKTSKSEYSKRISGVLSRHPHDRPRQLKITPAPLFHCATRNASDELRRAYRWFVMAYKEAADRVRSGHQSVSFPPGSFPSRLPFVPDLLAT